MKEVLVMNLKRINPKWQLEFFFFKYEEIGKLLVKWSIKEGD